MRTTNILIFCRTFSLHFSQMDSPSKFSHLLHLREMQSNPPSAVCFRQRVSGLALQSEV